MKTGETGSSVFWKLVGQIWNYKKIKNIEIKNSKGKLEPISKILVKTWFKNSKQRILQNSSKCKMV
jgi:hypothetical protein